MPISPLTLSQFLEGFFQHHMHCEEFISTIDGLDALGRITALPCLPYDFGNSVHSDSLVQVIRTLAEANAQATLSFLSRLVKSSLDENTEFWGNCGGPSKLSGMIEFDGSFSALCLYAFPQMLNISAEEEKGTVNGSYRALITLQTRVTLISEVYASAGYTTGRTAHTILQALLGPRAPSIVPALGSLHRACVWEGIVLKRQLPDIVGPAGEVVGQQSVPVSAMVGQTGEGDATRNVVGDANVQGFDEVHAPSTNETERAAPRKRNAQALKQLVTQIPAALAPLFQGEALVML